MCCVPTVGLALVAWVDRAIGVNDTTMAVVLETLRAVWAIFLQTAARLGADADALALLDVGHVLTDFDGFADDFVADNTGYDESEERLEGESGETNGMV